MSSSTRARTSRGRSGELSISTVTGVGNQVTERPRVVKLHKKRNGYGFFLKTHQNSPMHFISEVESGSAAETAGIRDGDILACINGQDVMHASHDQCVAMVRDSGTTVELTVASRHVMEIFYHHNITVEPNLPDNWQYLTDSTFFYSNAAFEDASHEMETSFGGLEGGVSALMKNNKNDAATTSSCTSRFASSHPVALFSTDSSLEDPECSPAPPRICELTKDNNEYGFLLLRTEDVGGHYLTDIKFSGPADKAGIKNGDRLLEVNDVSIGFKSYEEVIDLISSSSTKVTLMVLTESAKSNQGLRSRSSELSLQPPRFCELQKKESGYGFTLSCVPGVYGCDHFINNVERNGAAEGAGIINGDRLLEVNGISTNRKTHDEVVELIVESGSKISIMVLSDRFPTVNMEIKSNAREDFYRGSMSSLSTYEYRIIKNPQEEFEFFLSDDRIRDAQVIRSISPGGPADRCGLRNGDTIIEVNGINVENKPHSQVVSMIKNSMPSNEVKLLVHGQSRTLPQLDRSLHRHHEKEKCLIS